MDRGGAPLLLARLVLGGLFVYMGALKLGQPFEFLKQIRLYHMLPEDPPIFLNAVAVVLPWLEVLCGASILLGARIRGAAVVAALMLAVFTPAILMRALAIRAEVGTPFLKIEFDCGCGTGVVVIWKKLLENTLLFCLAVYTTISRANRFADIRDPLRVQAPASHPKPFSETPAGLVNSPTHPELPATAEA
jgi:uncharacterized membrane protein YphA (DoxX/SURF4 family)